jgi:hypothetical protein
MLRRTLFILLFFGSFFLSNCKKDDSPTASGDCPASQRTGAICNDGTTTTATGSGACSSHGGVRSWICN